MGVEPVGKRHDLVERYSVYLLYWYKTTLLALLVQQYNIGKRHDLVERYLVVLLYWYKSTNTDAREA